jgi:hypothetical protein
MSQPHLCFYSAKSTSKYCVEFLEALASSPYAREFRFICVDTQPGKARPQLPSYVRAVPTLMIAGEGEPRTDGRVMDWLMDRRLRDREAVAAPGSGARIGTSTGGGGGAAASVDGPAAFSSDMMGFGDEGFSFIGEDATAEKGSTNRMLGNMASLNDIHMLAVPDSRASTSFTIMGGAGAGASAADSGGPKVSEKSKALDDAYTRMLAEREASVSGPKPPANPFGGGGRR